jgi:hypothetical protein
VEYYPNLVGIDPNNGAILENPVVSKVVLTRNWNGRAKTKASARTAGKRVPVNGEFPETIYKERTELNARPELKKIEINPVTPEQFKERADKLVERFVNQNR